MAGDKEFVDKEHESAFCLETNFMEKGETDENSAQLKTSKGEIRGNSSLISIKIETFRFCIGLYEI